MNIWNRIARFDHLDMFGMYFILDTETQGQKYLVLPAEQAAALLRISDAESLRNIQSQYLINVSITAIYFINCLNIGFPYRWQ